MSKDLFKTTDEANPNDISLGNDFLDLDDPNNNGDFSEQEQQIAADGVEQQDGNIDNPGADHSDQVRDFDFKDEDVFQDEELDVDEFDTNEFLRGDNPNQDKDDPQEEEEEEQQEEADDDNSFLADINQRYGKNFKTEAEFQAFMKGENPVNEPQSVVTEKEQEQYEKNKGNIGFIDQILQMDDKAAYIQDAQIQHFRKHGQKMSEEQMEELEAEVEQLDDQKLLKLYASNIRNKFSAEKANYEAFNRNIDTKVQTAKNRIAEQNKQELYNSFKNIYVQGDKRLLGVELKSSDLQDAYNDVTSGELVKRIMSNPQLAANLALIEKKLPEIKKAFTQPNGNDGIKSVLGTKRTQKKGQANRLGSNVRSSQRQIAQTSTNKADAEFLQ